MLSKYAYTNDNLARRTQIAYDGVAFGSPQEPITQVLTYNDRNELTGSQRDDSTALTRTYAYDPIGNRTGATQNEAPNADTITYVRNALNQYKQVAAAGQGGTLKQGLSYDEDGNLVERFIAGDMDCDGDVDMDDIDPFLVALQGQAAYEAQYANCNWLHADIDGDGDVDLDDLDVFVNLLSSGNAAVWVAYTWDAENRLVGVAPGSTPKSGDLKLAFVYDYMGRRVEKKVWTHNGSSWGDPTEHRKFVWNGWLLLMELDGLNDDAVLRKRTWGLDLAGLLGGGSSAGPASGRSTLEGAGGIGGLLAVHDATIGQSGADYVYFYDANGNVGQACDLSAGSASASLVAKYQYDPYGNVTSQSGAYASANPFRFSTKYFDDETGLGYWGYRYYDPKLGRWVSRDPIGEAGGRNLQAYLRNRPCDRLDSFGLEETTPSFAIPATCCEDVCGLEMGLRLKVALRSLAEVWVGLSGWQRYKVCYGIAHHTHGWDIHELAWEKWRFSDSGCGTGTCRGTVQVFGRCYKAHHVNYLLWGAVRRLCGANWYATMEAVTAHRVVTEGVRRDSEDPDALKDQVEGRQLWTYMGLRWELVPDENPYLTRGVRQQEYCKRCGSTYSGPLTLVLRKGLPIIGDGRYYKIAIGEAGGALYESDNPDPPEQFDFYQ